MAVKFYNKSRWAKLSTNFVTYEFDCKGKGCCTLTQIDDKLVEYLQKIRDHFGKAVTITSAYRCPIHNKNVGGATGSYHAKGMAADIVVNDVAPDDVAKYAESIGIKGIGLYETDKDGYFVHIDTRTTKSFWYGQSQQYRSTFGGGVAEPITVGLSILKKGMRIDDVCALQALLVGYKYLAAGEVDGDFGAKTEAAVIKFQKANGLGADGIVGLNTWKKLLKI